MRVEGKECDPVPGDEIFKTIARRPRWNSLLRHASKHC